MENKLSQTTIRVYISGPYSNGDCGENVRVAMTVGDILMRAGFVPFIPHLAHFWHISFPHTYDEWLDWDLAWLSTCDCMLRLPGQSPGADKEVAMARALRIPVYYSVEEVIDKAHPKHLIW